MERIVSSLLSLTLIILSLSIILPALLMHSGVRFESGLSKCISILSDAVENRESITVISKSDERIVLLVNETYRIEIFTREGELICTVEASPT